MHAGLTKRWSKGAKTLGTRMLSRLPMLNEIQKSTNKRFVKGSLNICGMITNDKRLVRLDFQPFC